MLLTWKRKSPLPALLLFLSVFFRASPAIEAQTPGPSTSWTMLSGGAGGLSLLDIYGRLRTVWRGGAVRKILPLQKGRWAALSEKGVLVSSGNLTTWEERNNGLPVKTLKLFQNGRKSFVSVTAEIKDLEIHPENSGIMVCAVKDGVYLSRDEGRSWTDLGMPSFNSNGIKAVAVIELPARGGVSSGEELTVFCSHGIYGLYYLKPDSPDPKWTELNAGLERLETTDNPDEIADIAVVRDDFPEGEKEAVYVSQTFRRRIYRLDWEAKRFELVLRGGSDFGAAESLWPGNNGLFFVRESGIDELDPVSRVVKERNDLLTKLARLPGNAGAQAYCAVFREAGPRAAFISLSELWLLDGGVLPARVEAASGQKGLYLPVNHAMDSASLKPYLDTIERGGLNMVVIDMKDDYGRLRFTPRDKSIERWGRVFRPVDIDAFLGEMKKRGVYTAARVVVFKDPEAAERENSRYAVWDGRQNKAWAGYFDRKRRKLPPGTEEDSGSYVTEILPSSDSGYEILRTYYDERWVDPYAEEYWEYIALLSEELEARGFDEIQFDYIRFPTDGVNLRDAVYRWRESSMDMDSAILSFLRHIRPRVNVPVSVDIYGANGWYRTGARTGQEVEMLAPWVDVICPMYYPSHFEQNFLAQEPQEQRPYRIYYQGTRRTASIARGRVVIRPWIQAFYLNVSYDRRFYNQDYVRREIEGSDAAGRGGYTHWNNSGRYDDIPAAGAR